MLLVTSVLAVSGVFGCGPLEIKTEKKPEPVAIAPDAPPVGIAVTERALRGGRLVLISQRGERLREITRIGRVSVRDNGAAWSPDGRFLVFASSRSRDSVDETSLWIIAAEPGAKPRRLTRFQRSIDRDPVWAADGRSLLFSSNRSGSFDIYRLALRERADGLPTAVGQPVALTSGPDLDFHPSPEPGGERIAFMRADADGERSRIWIVDGEAARPLTDGPADVTPAWSPDGRRIAFAAPGPERRDADLYTVALPPASPEGGTSGGPDGGTRGTRELVVAEALSDQTGPVWSADGRYLFCTSIFRSQESNRPVHSSVTFVDLSEPTRVVRALHSRIATDSRMEPALEPRQLDPRLLHDNLPYKDALQRAVESDLIRAAEAAERMRQDGR